MPSATLASCPATLCRTPSHSNGTLSLARKAGSGMTALAAGVFVALTFGATVALAQNGTVIPRTNSINQAAPAPTSNSNSSSNTRTSNAGTSNAGGSTRSNRSALPADPGAAPPAGQGFLKIIRLGPSGSLSLREGPGTEYNRLTLLPGDTVGILPIDAFGRWTKITYCGYEGWVAASFTAPMLANESPVHRCRSVGPLGINSDPAAQGSDGSLVLAPVAGGLNGGVLPRFTNGELTKIATDEFDLPIRLASSGRRLGRAPTSDPYLECIGEAEQDPVSEATCVQASLNAWQTAMAEALERHRQIATSRDNKDLERNQSAWRSYAQGTCNDFAQDDAPPILKSHPATCQLMFTRDRALELEQLLVQIDSDCRLCQREAAEPPQQAASDETQGAGSTSTN